MAARPFDIKMFVYPRALRAEIWFINADHKYMIMMILKGPHSGRNSNWSAHYARGITYVIWVQQHDWTRVNSVRRQDEK